MKFRSLLFVVCIAFILFASVAVKPQDSEIEKIISEVSVDTQKGAIFNYTYLMRFSFHRHKFGGRKFTRLYEAILPSRYSVERFFGHPLILVEDSENALTDEQIRNTRQFVAEQLQKIEEAKDDKAANNERPAEDGGYWTVGFSSNGQRLKIDVLQLLKNVKLSNLQRTELNGRKIISIEFMPNTTATFEKSLSYLPKIEGQIRIDETDKRIIAIEGYAPGEFAKWKDKTDEERRREAVFLFQQAKVEEGFWFPQVVRLNFNKHPEIFEEVELEFAFSNYKKSRVDIDFQEKQEQKTEASPTKQ